MGSKIADQKKRKRNHVESSKEGFTNRSRYSKIERNQSETIIHDSRFASVHSDPRFMKVRKRETKVALDSRFKHILSGKNFGSSSAPLDKRGKPKVENSANSLRHYYRFEGEEGTQEEKETVLKDGEEVEEDSEGEGEGEESPKNGTELLGTSSNDDEENQSGSDDDESTEEEEDEEMLMDDELEAPMENIPVIDKETHRLAVTNMDWSHVKAVDLYAMLSSFLTTKGQIISVSVYPSEFGLERMKEEDIRGPVGIFDDDHKSKDEDNDDEDEIDEGKLRAYEMSRLRYYYAVVECDSVTTADNLYKSCDGVEFERSSNVLDLRFIPDSMEFKHPPRDVATEVPASYGGLDFQTRALQQSKIQISWDEDEPHRVKTLNRNFNADQLADLEFKEFLASDESDTDGDGNDSAEDDQSDKKSKKIDMYRSLIQGSDDDGEEEGGKDMEVTFNTGLEDLSKRLLEKRDQKTETYWESYLRKRSEKKKLRKNKSTHSSEDRNSDSDQELIQQSDDDFFLDEQSVQRQKKAPCLEHHNDAEASTAELKLLLNKKDDSALKGYNLKSKKSKGKKSREVTDKGNIPTEDLDDPRFATLYSEPLFALDPTDPQFKRSGAYSRLLATQNEKKRSDRKQAVEPKNGDIPPAEPRLRMDEVVGPCDRAKKEKSELLSTVKSLKMKSKQVDLLSRSSSSKSKKNVK